MAKRHKNKGAKGAAGGGSKHKSKAKATAGGSRGGGSARGRGRAGPGKYKDSDFDILKDSFAGADYVPLRGGLPGGLNGRYGRGGGRGGGNVGGGRGGRGGYRGSPSNDVRGDKPRRFKKKLTMMDEAYGTKRNRQSTMGLELRKMPVIFIKSLEVYDPSRIFDVINKSGETEDPEVELLNKTIHAKHYQEDDREGTETPQVEQDLMDTETLDQSDEEEVYNIEYQSDSDSNSEDEEVEKELLREETDTDIELQFDTPLESDRDNEDLVMKDIEEMDLSSDTDDGHVHYDERPSSDDDADMDEILEAVEEVKTIEAVDVIDSIEEEIVELVEEFQVTKTVQQVENQVIEIITTETDNVIVMEENIANELENQPDEFLFTIDADGDDASVSQEFKSNPIKITPFFQKENIDLPPLSSQKMTSAYAMMKANNNETAYARVVDDSIAHLADTKSNKSRSFQRSTMDEGNKINFNFNSSKKTKGKGKGKGKGPRSAIPIMENGYEYTGESEDSAMEDYMRAIRNDFKSDLENVSSDDELAGLSKAQLKRMVALDIGGNMNEFDFGDSSDSDRTGSDNDDNDEEDDVIDDLISDEGDDVTDMIDYLMSDEDDIRSVGSAADLSEFVNNRIDLTKSGEKEYKSYGSIKRIIESRFDENAEKEYLIELIDEAQDSLDGPMWLPETAIRDTFHEDGYSQHEITQIIRDMGGDTSSDFDPTLDLYSPDEYADLYVDPNEAELDDIIRQLKNDDSETDILAGSSKKVTKRKAKSEKAKNNLNLLEQFGSNFLAQEEEAARTKFVGKGKNKAPVFGLSDEELELQLQNHWRKSRESKRQKKIEREQLRQAGMLGKKFKKTGVVDLKDKYHKGMYVSDVYHELQIFHGDSGRNTLAFPPMDNHARKVIQQFCTAFNLKTKVVGDGLNRCLVAIKTGSSNGKINFQQAERLLGGRKFFPSLDKTKKDVPLNWQRFTAGDYEDGIVHLPDSYPVGMSVLQVYEVLTEFNNNDNLKVLNFAAMPPLSRTMLIQYATAFKFIPHQIGSEGDRFISIVKDGSSGPNPVDQRLIRKLLDTTEFLSNMGTVGAPASRKELLRGSRERHASSKGPHHRDGDIVGADAPEIGRANIGRLLLEKMGWKTGTGLGVSENKGIPQPIQATVKITKLGIGRTV